jgi:hypothetical protein
VRLDRQALCRPREALQYRRDRQFQLFWANISVLGPSIYSRPPVPVVVPRFKDRKPLPRLASELLERSAVVGFELEDIDASCAWCATTSRSRPRRGLAALRGERRASRTFTERVCIDHAGPQGLPARSGAQVERRRLGRLPRLADQAGDAQAVQEDLGRRLQGRAYSKRKDDKDADDGKLKAGVWELWSKSQNKVVWVAEGCDVVLDEGAPHLTLEGFFPCPRPAYATVQRRTLIPVPDILFYKDQLEEINELTARIGALADALKVRGFYPAGAGDIGDAIEAAIKSTTTIRS